MNEDSLKKCVPRQWYQNIRLQKEGRFVNPEKS